MSPKRSKNDTNPDTSKRARTMTSLDVKLEIIKRFEQGDRGVDIARSLGLPASTVRTIFSEASKYKAYAKVAVTGSIKMFRNRDSIMVKMERMLVDWIQEQTQQDITLTTANIQEEAKNIFNNLKNGEETESEIEFNASKGWFDRFKRRAGLFNNKIHGGIQDVEPPTDYSNVLSQLIDEEETKKDSPCEQMETLLASWIEEQIQQQVILTAPLIQEKAKGIFNCLRNQKGIEFRQESFNATKGWYNRFKKKLGLQNIKIQSESTDMKPVARYCSLLKELILEEDFSPKQIFNIKETGLFWKKMPNNTCISEEKDKPSVKASKDKLILL